jgi:hypothetical protein
MKRQEVDERFEQFFHAANDKATTGCHDKVFAGKTPFYALEGVLRQISCGTADYCWKVRAS